MNEYYAPISYEVTSAEEGWLLKTVLRQRMQVSRSLLTQLKRTERGIELNGVRQRINVKVMVGDVIDIRMQQERSDDILPQPLPVQQLYEDDHLLIVNKAADIVVHPTRGHYTNTLANGVVYHWRRAGVNHRFRPIHRLDQQTSGVIAIAKNPYVHHILSEMLKARQVVREYVAIVHGQVNDETGTINAPIDRDLEQPHLRIVTSGGYEAITHYEVLQRHQQFTLVRARLETGRTHQIRVHMHHIGHPIIGDALYKIDDKGTGLDSLIERQALHAAKLVIIHPITKQSMTFTAPLPPDMEQVLDHVISPDG